MEGGEDVSFLKDQLERKVLDSPVAKYWRADILDWRWDKLYGLLPEEVNQEMATVRLGLNSNERDLCKWMGDTKGVVTLRGVYWDLLQ